MAGRGRPPKDSTKKDPSTTGGSGFKVPAKLAQCLRNDQTLVAYLANDGSGWFFNPSTAKKHFGESAFKKVTFDNLK